MFCPVELRGRYYPTETVRGCEDYHECPVCYRCQSYQPTRAKCNRCESVRVWSGPGESQPVRTCPHRTERAVLADAKLLVQHYRSPLYHPQRALEPGRIRVPSRSEAQQLRDKLFRQVWSKLQIGPERERQPGAKPVKA